MYKCFLLTLLILSFCAAGNAQSKLKRTPAKPFSLLQITFENRVDTQLLLIDSTYINPHGEAFSVKNFRYYISNFSLIDIKGKTWSLPQAYYLIDERKPESKSILFKTFLTQISAVRFWIGVDSSKNTGGVQTGALDPANGMFWTWNSGYIMAKLEGTSPASAAPQSGFTYHIGGFRKGENVLRQVTLELPKPVTLSTKEMTSITLVANVNSWFQGKSFIKISQHPFCMNPGKLAMQIADNYAEMFSVIP